MPAKAAPRLVVVVDVSGSIDDALLQRFAREIEPSRGGWKPA
jgi:predicted metal-dependent peptidase